MLPSHKPKPATSGLKVGFYGCRDTLVRVSWVKRTDGENAPRKFTVDCPVCEQSHEVSQPMWRAAHSSEEFLLSNVHLENSPCG